jgi:hypothetical protein
MTERYKVIPESASEHCCFQFSVVDTEEREYGQPKTVCETFEREPADMIARALNRRR